MINVSLTNTKVPTVDNTLEILNYHTNRFGIPIDYDRLLQYYTYYKIKGGELMRVIGKTIGLGEVDNVKDSEMIQFLKLNNATNGLALTEGGRFSVSEEALQAWLDTKLYAGKDFEPVVKAFMEAKGYLSSVTMFENVINKFVTLTFARTNRGTRLGVLKPTWVPQNTGRIGAADPAIMNFKRTVQDIFCAPEGYVYWHCDSGQVDPRITQSYIIRDPQLSKCTMLYDDAYYGYYHFACVLTDEDRFSRNMCFDKIEISDEVRDARQDIKTFGNAVVYGSTSNVGNNPVKEALIHAVGNHPALVARKKDLENRLDRGERIFYTAFGTPIDITKGPSEKNYPDKKSDKYFKHLLNCALNSPVQGTAADLMRISVQRAHEIIMTDAPKSAITAYVHDAGGFIIHEDEVSKVEKELTDITAYQVDDWIPIHAELEDPRRNTSSLEHWFC